MCFSSKLVQIMCTGNFVSLESGFVTLCPGMNDGVGPSRNKAGPSGATQNGYWSDVFPNVPRNVSIVCFFKMDNTILPRISRHASKCEVHQPSKVQNLWFCSMLITDE